MNPRRKILVAMSGGVDSSVAAALLAEAGHEVVGVFMCLGGAGAEKELRIADIGLRNEDEEGRGLQSEIRNPKSEIPRRQSCCSPQDSGDARAVAGKLGIPFYVLDFQPAFRQLIDYFVDEYTRGRTPNPCVRCNSRLKFGRLLDYAATIGADAVATGHYARIVATPAGPRLGQAADSSKDQSYVLFALPRPTLGRVVFPLGEWTKAQVRARAAELGLAVADKPDSQDICFVPDGNYARLVEQHRPGIARPGDVLDPAGRVVGRHRGYPFYTIGQRRGVGIAAGSPIYVTAIDPAANTITVGPAEALLGRELTCSGVVWHVDLPEIAKTQADETGVRAVVRIRYRSAPAAATVQPTGPDTARVTFDQPVAAITPGQAAVFYDEAGLVLGGGWIDRAGGSTTTGPSPAG